MRVIPVIDLMNGQVVRGVGGKRSEYQPIKSQIASDASPATIAKAFVEHFGFDTVYVADLDAIQRGAPNVGAWNAIHAAGPALWLDAGVGTPQAAVKTDQSLLGIAPTTTMIAALESVPAPLCVSDIVGRLGPQRVKFSLDLQNGRPLTNIDMWKNEQPLEIARWVIRAGIEQLIVLDLADVGVAGGTATIELCRKIRREFPRIDLTAGGGVRSVADLKSLADAGCDAALVASALHDGQLTPAELRQLTTDH